MCVCIYLYIYTYIYIYIYTAQGVCWVSQSCNASSSVTSGVATTFCNYDSNDFQHPQQDDSLIAQEQFCPEILSNIPLTMRGGALALHKYP